MMFKEGVISADAICGNCKKPRSQHYVDQYPTEFGIENREYCFTNTNGDVFTDYPDDGVILEMILEDRPNLYDEYLARWRKKNKHL